MTMKTRIYQIFDTIASLPVTNIVGFPRPEAAIRWFQELAGKEGSPIQQYPKDHTLLDLGQQDLESGEITAESPPHPIYDGVIMLEQLDRQAAAAARDTTIKGNGAMQGLAEQTPNLPGEVLPAPSAEDLSCKRCQKHYTMHRNNGHCPDNSGARFQPGDSLKRLYQEYLDSRAQAS